jgi:hypothetical protein
MKPGGSPRKGVKDMKRKWTTTSIHSLDYVLEVLDRAVANHRFFTATINWSSLHLNAYEYRPYVGLGPGVGYYHIIGKLSLDMMNSGKLPTRKMTATSFRAALKRDWKKILELETE